MEANNFWNDAAKHGAILGAILSASMIFEALVSMSSSKGLYMFMALEFLLLIVVHYLLLHHYTRRRSQLFSAEEGFSFGQGYGYLIAVSVFAGFLVSIAQYLCVHVVIGYEQYMAKVVAGLTDLLAQDGGIPASVEGILAPMLTQLQQAPAPSILAVVWGGIWQGLLFGAIFGLIIAGVLSRAPKPFGEEEQGE